MALATAVVGLLGVLSSLPSEAAPAGSTVRFRAGSTTTEPAKGWSLSPFRTAFSGAAEPTIGVPPDGVVFYDLNTKVVRSNDVT